MPRNIEIKARIASVEALLPRARALADEAPAQLIEQDDTFFSVPQGRLKLRVFADGAGELIHYVRADADGPKLSDYVIAPVTDPQALSQALQRACGLLGRVRKQRLLLWVGTTRLHLDRVDGLGDFLELEVVLGPGQSPADGQRQARALMAALGLADADLVAGAYLDLQRARSA